jgi:hypothetical protein
MTLFSSREPFSLPNHACWSARVGFDEMNIVVSGLGMEMAAQISVESHWFLFLLNFDITRQHKESFYLNDALFSWQVFLLGLGNQSTYFSYFVKGFRCSIAISAPFIESVKWNAHALEIRDNLTPWFDPISDSISRPNPDAVRILGRSETLLAVRQVYLIQAIPAIRMFKKPAAKCARIRHRYCLLVG